MKHKQSRYYKDLCALMRVIPGVIVLGIGILCAPLDVLAASYYVHPNPNPNGNCTHAKPCKLNTGLKLARPGDEVVLKDGVYKQNLITKRNGTAQKPIVIRAHNRHAAIIRGLKSTLEIRHDHIVIRSLMADNQGSGTRGTAILLLRGTPYNPIDGILIEGNKLVNGGNCGVLMQNATNVVLRHNLIDGTGSRATSHGPKAPAVGEGFYLSSTKGAIVKDVQIYGNIIRDVSHNFIDYKSGARAVNVHHNIFEGLRSIGKWNGDGLVRSAGNNTKEGNYFQHNIVRNSPPKNHAIKLKGNRVDVIENVFSNIGSAKFISKRTRHDFMIKNNLICNGPASNLGANKFKLSCTTREQHILQETRSLPGVDRVGSALDF